MSLAARTLNPPEQPDARRARPNHPKGFEPGVKFDAEGNPEQITTPPTAHLGNEDEWNTAVEAMGYTVPAGYRLRLVEAKYDPAAWHRDTQGEDAVTRAVWRYRFAVEQSTSAEDAFDHVATLKPLRRNRSAVKPSLTGRVDVRPLMERLAVPASQEGGGTAALLERFHRQIDQAKARGYRASQDRPRHSAAWSSSAAAT